MFDNWVEKEKDSQIETTTKHNKEIIALQNTIDRQIETSRINTQPLKNYETKLTILNK